MKILLVDDEPGSNEALEKLLWANGHDCLCVAGAHEGIAAMREHRPDLVITEFVLLDGDGFDVIRQVRQTLPSTPVILATAYEVPEMAARKLGAAGYLRKPFSSRALMEVIIRTVLEDRERVATDRFKHRPSSPKRGG